MKRSHLSEPLIDRPPDSPGMLKLTTPSSVETKFAMTYGRAAGAGGNWRSPPYRTLKSAGSTRGVIGTGSVVSSVVIKPDAAQAKSHTIPTVF